MEISLCLCSYHCVLSQGELHQAWESSQDVNPVYPEEMVVFHSYVSLPEGNRLNHSGSVFPPKVACFINTRSEQKKVAIYVFLSNLKKDISPNHNVCLFYTGDQPPTITKLFDFNHPSGKVTWRRLVESHWNHRWIKW